MGEFFAGLVGWVGDFVQWLLTLVPRRIVVPWDEAVVLWRRGHAPINRAAGVIWYLPFNTRLERVARTSTYLRITCDVLHEGANYFVSANVQYSIEDAAAYLGKNQDSDDSIDDIAQGAIFSELVMAESLVDSITAWSEDSSELVQTVQERVRHFGVAVEQVKIMDLSQPQSLRHIGSAVFISQNFGE